VNGGTNISVTDAGAVHTVAISGILDSANGGSSVAFFKVSGPASSIKTYAFPNVSTTVLTTNDVVTVPQGGTGLTSGTSGGIPYFSDTTHLTSSALLAANKVLIGGGAGSPPTSAANLKFSSN